MKDIVYNKHISGAINFHVLDVSDELKIVIRENLSSICNGAAKATRNTVLYSYKNTLDDFLEKYDSKADATKKGLIGELLTHIILLHYEKDLIASSIYFNMEENSIKKGFDLVLQNVTSQELWFVEVKSGECGQESSIDKLRSLLSLAKNGLVESLSSQRKTLWNNAIHGATITLSDEKSNLRSIIQGILEGSAVKAIQGTSKSVDYNAILVAVCYTCGKTAATDDEFQKSHLFHSNAAEFKQLISVSLQKNTYKKVEDFLRQEACNA